MKFKREEEREREGGVWCLVIKGPQPARLKYPQCLNYTVPPGSYASNFSMTT